MATLAPPVDPREYGSLNRRFYRAEPAEYLELRLWALTSTIGEVVPTREAGFDDFKLTREGPPTDEQRQRYAALESTVLLHHAAEAMIRLYFAHSHRNPCPWLEMAKLRNFAEFKRRIGALKGDLDTDETMDDVTEVFTWTAVRDPFQNMPEDVWASHRSGLKDLLRFCIDVLLDEAPLYNAAKHGLAALAGRAGLSLGDPSAPIFSVDGDALAVLEQSEDDDDVRRWKRTTRWVYPTQSMALVGVIIRAIESLWEAARGHYHQPNDPKKVWVAEADTIEKLLTFHQKMGVNVTSYSETLVHEER